MTGLSVLYAKEAAEEQEWAAVPARDRTGRLREVYWARRAESTFDREVFLSMKLSWRPNRSEIGRGRDDPGDGFIYLVDMTPMSKTGLSGWRSLRCSRPCLRRKLRGRCGHGTASRTSTR